jgi:hypothetical protein
LSPIGHGVIVSCCISIGTGMFVGIGFCAIGTHDVCGCGSAPPRNPSVMPLVVWPFVPSAMPGAGFMFPFAARRKSSPPVVPGEMLERSVPRFMCPSVPMRIGMQVFGIDE